MLPDYFFRALIRSVSRLLAGSSVLLFPFFPEHNYIQRIVFVLVPVVIASSFSLFFLFFFYHSLFFARERVFVHHHSILFIRRTIRNPSTNLPTTKIQTVFEIKYHG